MQIMPNSFRCLLQFQKAIFYFIFMIKFPFLSDESPKPAIYLWECISWISVFLPLHMTICITKTVYDRFWTDSILTLTSIGLEALWFFCSFMCMVHFKRRQKDIIDLMDKIEQTFKWRSPRGKTYVHMEGAYKMAKYLSIFWQLATTMAIALSLAAPLFRKPILLPIPSWYPIDNENIYQFAGAYFIQSWSKMVMVSSFASGSSFNISFSLLCSGQFNVLRCGLKNLIYTSGLYHRFPSDTLNNNCDWTEHAGEYAFVHEIEESPPTEPTFSLSSSDLNNRNLSQAEIKSFQDAIKNCVVHHLDIVRICAMMEDFLNFFALLRVGEMTVQICFLAFMSAKTNSMTSLIFMFLTFCDLFLLTYPAEYIQFQSNAIGPSLMLGPWYLVSKHFRNDFIIIMAYSMRPVVFTAGKFLRLNIDRFRLVTTTAFSIYTLLSSFDNR